MGLSVVSFFVQYVLVDTHPQSAQHDATAQRWPDVIFDDLVLQRYDASGVLVEEIAAKSCEHFSAQKYSVLRHFTIEHPVATRGMAHSVQGDVATMDDQKEGAVLMQGNVRVMLNKRSGARWTAQH